MNLRSIILTGLFACFFSLGITGAHANLLEKIKAAGGIRIATPMASPPFGMPGPDMKIVGYDIDMAQFIADKLGVKLISVPTTSSNRIPYLQSDRADIIVSSLGKTAEREKVLDFTIPYAPYFLGVFTAPGMDPIKSAEDLAGKTIGVSRGAIDDLIITEIAPSSTNIQRYDDAAAQVAAFQSGRVDIISTANVSAAMMARQTPDRAPVLQFKFRDSPCSIGVPKNEPELLQRINEIILEAKADGTLNELSKKWFMAELPAEF